MAEPPSLGCNSTASHEFVSTFLDDPAIDNTLFEDHPTAVTDSTGTSAVGHHAMGGSTENLNHGESQNPSEDNREIANNINPTKKTFVIDSDTQKGLFLHCLPSTFHLNTLKPGISLLGVIPTAV